MAYQQSPGVQIVEKDASAITVGLSSTVGATVGAFRWGPAMTPMLMSNDSNVISTFGEPDDTTFPYFFAASNFLAYTNSCWVNRVVGSTAKNASASGAGISIKNFNDYETVVTADNTAAGVFASRYPGVLGSGLKVSLADSATFATWEYKELFSKEPGTSDFAISKMQSMMNCTW